MRFVVQQVPVLIRILLRDYDDDDDDDGGARKELNLPCFYRL